MIIDGKEFSEKTIKEALKAHCDWPEEKRVPRIRIATLSPTTDRVLVRIERPSVFVSFLRKYTEPMVLAIGEPGNIGGHWKVSKDREAIETYYNIKEIK